MSHVRQQIRDQLKTTLTGLATTGANVFASRVYDHDALPSLAIYTLSEELGSESANKQMRLLNIVLEVRAKATTNLDNTLDTISAEIEAALFSSGDTTLSGKCKDIDFEGVDIELSGDSDQPVGLMTMRFACLYRVDKADVTTLIS